MRLPLSVCLIVRDEERRLPRSLSSVAPFVAETIVVDTGSTDRTLEIAAEHGARVAEFRWCDDFAAARNFATSLASQPHILVLDADEWLAATSLPSLEAYCRIARPVIGRVRRTNLSADQATPLSVESLTRLYPNAPGFRHHGRIHEQLLHRGVAGQTIDTDVQLLHSGYTGSSTGDAAKIGRNLRLLELARADDPGNSYVAYQMGRTQQAAGRLAEAITAYRQALAQLRQVPAGESPYLSSLLLQLGYALLEQRDVPGLFDVLALGTDLYPDFTDLYFLYGLALMQLDDASRVADIQLAFEHCLTLGEPNSARYESVPGVGSYRAFYNLGVFHGARGDEALAGEWFARAARLGYQPASAASEAA